MKAFHCLLLLSAPLTLAQGLQSLTSNYLFARQSEDCSIESTCSECFGAGNVLCDNAGCFNPHKGEQCCAGGYVCVAKSNSCCQDFGPGTTGKDGVVPPPSSTTSGDPPLATSWTCTGKMTNEECCQAGNPSLQWCSGQWPGIFCYNPKYQVCCSEGTVCMGGKDCCDLVSASAVTPGPSDATKMPSSSTSAMSRDITEAPTAARTTSTAATGPAASTSSSAATKLQVVDGVGLAAGIGALLAGGFMM
ncbi:hypothetical protein FE257_005274 [Aspergillus nanangensis]|uniref:GPI anchored protein n=1 Tax=Aspergillus nanangensis TaxID=2582783 RepID=A0AAD4CSP7_ASPNN|nr:hypothetical protein FE257_005274 [Aspergillus nanangensis]